MANSIDLKDTEDALMKASQLNVQVFNKVRFLPKSMTKEQAELFHLVWDLQAHTLQTVLTLVGAIRIAQHS